VRGNRFRPTPAPRYQVHVERCASPPLPSESIPQSAASYKEIPFR
jgi:hypothetical protein